MNQDRIAEPNPWERREDDYDIPQKLVIEPDHPMRKHIWTWPPIQGPVMVEWINE